MFPNRFAFRSLSLLKSLNRWLASMKWMKNVMPLRMSAVLNKERGFLAEFGPGCDNRRSFLSSRTLFLGEALRLDEGTVALLDCAFPFGCAIEADHVASARDDVVFVVELFLFLLHGCSS